MAMGSSSPRPLCSQASNHRFCRSASIEEAACRVSAMSKKKKKQSVVPLFAYTDESGNTGQNLFDPAQPYFFTGTLLTKADVDLEGTNLHCELLGKLGVKELHGNQLGLAKINLIADEIRSFLESYGATFIFTQVEKRHHAASRLCFAILDSDYNKAVSPLHDLSAIFHRKLALDIRACLTHGEVRDFWEAFESVNLKKFVEILENVRMRVLERISDARGRSLLMDALSWAIANPRELLRGARTKVDSVNVLALDLLVAGVQKFTSKDARVVVFRHDVQDQFGKEIAVNFELGKNVKADFGVESLVWGMKRSERFSCPIEMLSSDKSFGLQLVDIALYLASQAFVGTYKPRQDDCAALCDYILTNGYLQDFTYVGMLKSFEGQYRASMAREITSSQLEEGRKTVDRIEVARQKRMSS